MRRFLNGLLPAAVVAAAAAAIIGCGSSTRSVTTSAPTKQTSPSSAASGAFPSPDATPASGALAVWPSAAALATTEPWLRGRIGVTALAVIDSRGRLHGYRYDTPFGSASLVKAMLLVQYLRTHADIPRHVRLLLTRMIVDSDNAATDRVFAQVGTGGLSDLARVAGMGRFTPSNVWALSRVTAADQARFFYRIDNLVPQRHRPLLERVLGEHGPYRGWGIPQEALLRDWHVWWKDGWMHSARGELLLQAARLERHGITFAVAVIADGQPTSGYGVATMRGVGERLLR
jgi:Beta-lactamase enzyme family